MDNVEIAKNTIKIKEYVKDYQSQVIDLIFGIQQGEYQIPITKQDQPDLFSIEHFYQKGTGNFWIALHDDQVVGTIALLDIEDQQVALRKMFVAKNYRGKETKTALRLLNQAKQWAKENSVHDIFLGTTVQFLAAHRFYAKNGFQEIHQDGLPKNFPVLQVDKKFYQYSVR